MVNEIVLDGAASEREHRVWWVNTEDSLENERADRRKAQKSHKEKEREIDQEIMGLLWKQTQMLQTLMDLQVQQSRARLPLQLTENSIAAPPYLPALSQHSRGITGHIPTLTTPPWGTLKTTTASHGLTCESQDI
ncbi:hypothetical protein KIL84_010655, partial [Mauremys mutica]